MNPEESICDWPSDDGSQIHNSDSSSSEDEESQLAALAPSSRLRPAGSALSFVPFANWEPERSYDSELMIHWNMEWKIFVKNREQAGESELNIVISPRKFWKHILEPKVTEASTNKPWKRKDTKLVLSVTDRKTGKIQKRYPQIIDWAFVTTQIREWSRFLRDGKKITVALTFYYETTNVDTGRPGRGGATANQLADLEARTTTRSLGAYVKEAYSFAECRQRATCTNGSDHCVDLDGKHMRVLPHHVRILAEHLQAGKRLNGYDDVPDDFRRLVQDDTRQRDEREQKERMHSRKRKRRDSDCSPRDSRVIQCPCATHVPVSSNPPPKLVFPTSPVVELNLLSDEAVCDYASWHQYRVKAEEQKKEIETAKELTLKHFYDLNMIFVNREFMYRFFIDNGVVGGVAWRWVCDVKSFAKHLNMEGGI